MCPTLPSLDLGRERCGLEEGEGEGEGGGGGGGCEAGGGIKVLVVDPGGACNLCVGIDGKFFEWHTV